MYRAVITIIFLFLATPAAAQQGEVEGTVSVPTEYSGDQLAEWDADDNDS